jgi:DNA helicase HerA-like ATPase
MAEPLGLITRGSLSSGLGLMLSPGCTVEDMRVGRFVVIEGRENRFFCLVTDMELGATNPRVLLDPPVGNRLAGEVLEGIATFGQVAVTPMLMLPRAEAPDRLPAGAIDAASAAGTRVVAGDTMLNGPRPNGAHPAAAPDLQPVRTIPVHFSPVFDATEADFAAVFGEEDGRRFAVGMPLNMDLPVCINLERLVERSNGVFGKSGTGKSFLTRLLLCGVIRSGVASALVFDMHSEYGWETSSEEDAGTGAAGAVLPGLRKLFGLAVHVFALDRVSAAQRGVQVDGFLDVGLNHIEIEDIALLQEELGLSSAMIDTCYVLQRQLGERWLHTLLETEPESMEGVAARVGAHQGSLNALYRKLSQLRAMEFVKDYLPAGKGGLDEMMGWLERGEHVVLEFGRYRKPLVYMLVANIITRRIYAAWVDKTERYLQSKSPSDRPRRLVLCIEEAHKFLSPRAAQNTSFGTIAREMRKYNVTLLVVDQRPSGIDPEVASQLGTRLTALLTEENDIRAVFAGVAGGDQLRTVLASLDTKKQALILGHAVPMPVVIRVREYDGAFFKAVQPPDAARRPAGMAALQEAFGAP